jgi:hypothetical protein
VNAGDGVLETSDNGAVDRRENHDTDDHDPAENGDAVQAVGVHAPCAIVPLWLQDALPSDGSGRTALAVYVGLHRWTSGHNRTCFPSHATIARQVGVSDRTVQRALELLARVSAVSWEPRYKADPIQVYPNGRLKEAERDSNLYTLHRTQVSPGSRQTRQDTGDANGRVSRPKEPDQINQTQENKPSAELRTSATSSRAGSKIRPNSLSSVPDRPPMPNRDWWLMLKALENELEIPRLSDKTRGALAQYFMDEFNLSEFREALIDAADALSDHLLSPLDDIEPEEFACYFIEMHCDSTDFWKEVNPS